MREMLSRESSQLVKMQRIDGTQKEAAAVGNGHTRSSIRSKDEFYSSMLHRASDGASIGELKQLSHLGEAATLLNVRTLVRLELMSNGKESEKVVYRTTPMGKEFNHAMSEALNLLGHKYSLKQAEKVLDTINTDKFSNKSSTVYDYNPEGAQKKGGVKRTKIQICHMILGAAMGPGFINRTNIRRAAKFEFSNGASVELEEYTTLLRDAELLRGFGDRETFQVTNLGRKWHKMAGPLVEKLYY